MKTTLLLWCATGLLVALTGARAATHYVDAASTHAVPPFTNWANAAAVIQDAVDAAASGDEIVVTNGVYQTGACAVYGMSNRVAVTKPVTVRSVNGPDVTTIRGAGPIGENAIRCVYLTNGAVLMGFTLTNGATQEDGDPASGTILNSGAGVWSESQSAVITNCVLTGNSAAAYGGGAWSSTLNNCILAGNTAYFGGGASGSILNNCKLTGNSAADSGGGAMWSTVNNCTLARNSAIGGAGGGSAASTLSICTLVGNSGAESGADSGSNLNNCTLVGNSGI